MCILLVKDEGITVMARAPRNSTEQLYHFIFHLRTLMAYLVTHPIGKVSEASSGDVAQMLTHLPRRAAFVESGEDVGVIYTFDTPAPVMGDMLASRLETIKGQTHTTYCHPRQEIEAVINRSPQTITVTAGTVGSEIPRWEEL